MDSGHELFFIWFHADQDSPESSPATIAETAFRKRVKLAGVQNENVADRVEGLPSCRIGMRALSDKKKIRTLAE